MLHNLMFNCCDSLVFAMMFVLFEDFHIPTKISNHQTKRTSSQIQENHNNQTSSCATRHFSLDGLSLHHIRFHRSIKHHHLLFNFQLLRSHPTFSYITSKSSSRSLKKLNKQVMTTFKKKSNATDIFSK